MRSDSRILRSGPTAAAFEQVKRAAKRRRSRSRVLVLALLAIHCLPGSRGLPDSRGLPGLLGLPGLPGPSTASAAAAVPSSGSPFLPYRGPLKEQIEELFLDRTVRDAAERGEAIRLSFSKLQEYKRFIRTKRRFVVEHYVNFETIDRGRKKRDALERAEGRDLVRALDHIDALLETLENATDPVQIFELAGEIITVEYATRSYTDPIRSVKVPIHLKNMAFDWSAPRRTRVRGAKKEAGNLVNPATGGFYSTDEVAELIRAGEDLSTLDPPAHTLLRRAIPDISKVDVIPNYLAATDPVHEGLVPVYPEPNDPVVYYDRTHMTQSKPKIDIFYLDPKCRKKKPKKQKNCRRRYKLKFGMETHADPVANSLMMTLGYNSDVSMHLRRVKMYLGGKTLSELHADWHGYFDQQRLHTLVPLNSVLFEGDRGHGFDEGGEYIVFREAVAEPKFPEITRIGFFPFSEGVAAESREARGLFVFNVWIANADMKDEENNKVSIRQKPDGSYQTYMTQQDLGHSMGLILPEKANAFPWDAVEISDHSRAFGWLRGRIELNYFDLQNNGLLKTTTFSDAKWMTRLIAQLSRKQIADAVSLGRWPDGVDKLYVEKLINRRNQLVEAFGLSDEFPPLPVDRYLTTEDGAVVDGKLTKSRWEDSSVEFAHHWRAGFMPIVGYVGEGLLGALQQAIAAVDVVHPGEWEISDNLLVTPDILVNLARRVSLNPQSTQGSDQYIVEDTLLIGLRPRIGYIANFETTLSRKVSVAYPVSTRSIGLKGPSPAIRLLLPLPADRSKLPEKFVALREDVWGVGGQLTTSDLDYSAPVGLDARSAHMWSRRSIVDFRTSEPIVWIDQPKYWESELRAYLRLSVLKIPFFTYDRRNGSLKGELFRIDPNLIGATNADGDKILDRVTARGDYRDIERIAKGATVKLSSKFANNLSRLRLYFFNAFYRIRDERLRYDPPGEAEALEQYHVERRRTFAWSILDNGEEQQLRINGFLPPRRVARSPEGDSGEALAAVSGVSVRFNIQDRNTHSDELNAYYQLLYGLQAGRSPIPKDFDATAWEVSGKRGGRWAQMLVEGSVHFYDLALERLLAVDPESHWQALSRRLDVGPRQIERLRRQLRSAAPSQRHRARISPVGRRAVGAIRASLRTLGALKRARQAETSEERLRSLVHALEAANFRKGATYDPLVLATLLDQIDGGELVELGELAVRVRIGRSFDDESNLPERRDVVGSIGELRDLGTVDFPVFPVDGLELYNALNWTAKEPRAAIRRDASAQP